MKIYKKTWALLLFCTVAAVGAFYEPTVVRTSSLPVITPIKREDVAYISLDSALNHIVLRKENMWSVEQPVQEKADQMRIRSLLVPFRKGIPMDLKVDEGNFSEYGLDANQAIVVEMRSADDRTLCSFVVGADSDHGNTFVRLPNSEAVYRARIGGRARFAHKTEDLINQVVFDFSLKDLLEFRIQLVDGSGFQLKKTAEEWTIVPSLSQALDAEKVDRILGSLGKLRIGQSVSSTTGFAREGSFQIVLLDREERAALFSNGTQMLIDTSDGLFLVSSGVLEQLLLAPTSLLDKQILKGVSKEEIDRIVYSNKNISIEIQQDLSSGTWRALETGNRDLELRRIFFMINTLLSLEYNKQAVDPNNFEPEEQIELILLDGTSLKLQMGVAWGDSSRVDAVLWNKSVLPISSNDREVIRQGFALE